MVTFRFAVPCAAEVGLTFDRNGVAAVTVSVPRDWAAPAPRFAIAADVVRDGRYLGQITEAVVDLKGYAQF